MSADLRLQGPTRGIAAVARDAASPPDDAALDEALVRVRAKVEQHRASRARRGAVAGVLLVAAIALLVFGWRAVIAHRALTPLSYRVAGAEALPDGYIRGRHGEHPKVSFSEGSVVVLAAEARMRITSVDDRGGRLAIEDGEIRADIVHRAGARWTFDAGPYSVDVRGTSFSLAWRGADDWFDLRLHTGLLAIHTPWSSEPIVIHGGQRLMLKSAGHEATIRDLAEASERAAELNAPADSGAVVAPALSAALSAQPAPSDVTNASPKDHKPTWSERMASGALQSIVDEAIDHGVEATVQQRSSEELEILESAARYQKRPDIARQALLAQRARFAGSRRAKEAAFLLGRLAEAGDGVAAHEWYDRYLAEAPNGAFAAEASGRNLVVTDRIFGVERARPLAEAYLQRWPTGAHAQLAHSLLDHP